MGRILSIIITLLIPSIILSQNNTIIGKVLDSNLQPLANSSIYWINSTTGTSTDLNGDFTISIENIIDTRLIISFIGFKSDTVNFNTNKRSVIAQLKPSNNLQNIEIKENAAGTYIDKEKAIKVEVITKTELTKAACCDLAGCFETQLSVQPKVTNVITNSKELSVLGLSGVYNQILIDGIPNVSGLNYTYCISSIPGSIIQNIHVSQGLASILQGPESITGQLNVELKNKSEIEKIFINLYYNSFNMKQVDIDYNFNIGKWSSILSLHSTQPATNVDDNNDSFLDIAKVTKYSLYNKWIYGNTNKGLYTQTIIRFLDEFRVGGQIDFDAKRDKASDLIYGQVIDFYQPELINKTSYRIDSLHAIVLSSSISYHNQNSFFGVTHYKSDQLNIYLNANHQWKWKQHQIISGADFKVLDRNEIINFTDNLYDDDGLINKTYSGQIKNENIVGIYTENNFSWNNGNTQLLTGLRLDRHNKYGVMFTPRTLLKHNFNENTILRASIGTGWRTVNLFSENPNILGTNKDIFINHDLKPEKALNYGFNLQKSIYSEDFEIQLMLDVYKTQFLNQIYPDFYTNSFEIFVNNFEGTSTSNSIQGEIGIELFNVLGIKIGYNYLDIFRIENDEKIRMPFHSKHHFLNTISYRPLKRKWFIDINSHWIGKKKLLNTSSYPTEHQRPDMSDPYFIINGQFTYEILNTDIYLGCENILNFTQDDPIISADNPFGRYFDTCNIWGPTKGREFYLGLRKSF